MRTAQAGSQSLACALPVSRRCTYSSRSSLYYSYKVIINRFAGLSSTEKKMGRRIFKSCLSLREPDGFTARGSLIPSVEIAHLEWQKGESVTAYSCSHIVPERE